jgi:Mn-containing catalase
VFRYTPVLQNTAKPSKPDAVYAMKLQELLGGQFGEMTVTMQYLFQGFNCRMPGKYKDMIMDIATEEIGHVEMIATMVARLLEGAPGEATEKAAASSPVMAAVLGGMNPQHAIVAGGGATPANSQGVPWNAGYIVASGNLLADFRSNASAEAQGRLQTSRLYGMTDDPGVKEMLAFNLARDTFHQQQWLLGIQNLIDDGLSDVIEHSNSEVEDKVHDHTFWSFIDGPSRASEGLWATGSTLVDGGQPIQYLEEPLRLTEDDGLLPAPDPLLFGTYDGDQGPGAPGTATGSRVGGVAAKIKGALS